MMVKVGEHTIHLNNLTSHRVDTLLSQLQAQVCCPAIQALHTFFVTIPTVT